MLNSIKITAALFLVSSGAGLIVATVKTSTDSAVIYHDKMNVQETLPVVMPQKTTLTETAGVYPLPPRYWIAKKDSVIVAYAFKINDYYEGGEISYFIGIDTAGVIGGMALVDYGAFPGPLCRIPEKMTDPALFGKNTGRQPWFFRQCIGLSVIKSISVTAAGPEWPALDAFERDKLRSENAVTALIGARAFTQSFVKNLNDTITNYLNALGRDTHRAP